MKIYRIAKLNKHASITLYVKEHTRDSSHDTIYKLSWTLMSKVFYEWMPEWEKNRWAEFHQMSGMDMITIDGFETDTPTGTINFYLDGSIQEDRLPYYLNKIREYLDSVNIKYDEFRREKSNMYDFDVIRIPITDNPHGEIGRQEEPPEINMANNNAYFIFRDVLGIKDDLWGLEIPAVDLKRRIEYFESEDHLPEGSEVGQDSSISFNDLSDENFMSGRAGRSRYNEGKVRNMLDHIKNLCDWAISRGYKTIYLA